MDFKKFKTLFFCVTGTALEWYDFTIFGTLSSIIARLFFPEQNKTISLIYTFSIFALGFIIRPVGSAVLSHFGDRIGRKNTLCFSIICMTVPTVFIGFLPIYSQIGFYAPVFLLFLRLLQGFAAGGEYAGVITYLSETADKRKICFFSSFSVFGVVGGLFLGTIVSALITNLCSESFLYSYGWRIPFVASIVLGVVSYYIRVKLSETRAFEIMRSNNDIQKYPLVELIKKYTPSVIIVNNFFWLATVATYLVFIYIPARMLNNSAMGIERSLVITSVGTLLFVILIPVFGYFSDKLERSLISKIGSLSFILFAYPVFSMFNAHSLFLIYSANILFAVCMAAFVASIPALSSMLFPANVRFTGVALGLNISASMFGGTAPLIAIWLVNTTNNPAAPGLYLMVLGLIAFVSLLISKKYITSLKYLDAKLTFNED